MPIAKEYSIDELMKSVDYYTQKTNRKVMYEYLLINKINDTKHDALELADLLEGRMHYLNLIKYNPTGAFESSSPERVDQFKRVLQERKIEFGERMSMGEEIQGACGQLVI